MSKKQQAKTGKRYRVQSEKYILVSARLARKVVHLLNDASPRRPQ